MFVSLRLGYTGALRSKNEVNEEGKGKAASGEMGKERVGVLRWVAHGRKEENRLQFVVAASVSKVAPICLNASQSPTRRLE